MVRMSDQTGTTTSAGLLRRLLQGAIALVGVLVLCLWTLIAGLLALATMVLQVVVRVALVVIVLALSVVSLLVAPMTLALVAVWLCMRKLTAFCGRTRLGSRVARSTSRRNRVTGVRN